MDMRFRSNGRRSLTGKAPFEHDTSVETMNAILTEDPREITSTNEHGSPAVAKVVNRCLEEHPESRYQSAADLAFQLQDLSDVSSPVLAASSRRRRPLWIVAVIAALIIAAAGVVIGRYTARRALHRSTESRFVAARFSPRASLPTGTRSFMAQHSRVRRFGSLLHARTPLNRRVCREDLVAVLKIPATFDSLTAERVPFLLPRSSIVGPLRDTTIRA